MGRSCRVPRHLLSCIESSRARMWWRSECWNLCASLGWGWDFFRSSRRGKPPLQKSPFSALPRSQQLGRSVLLDGAQCHCPTCCCMPCQKSRCSDSAICGDFFFLAAHRFPLFTAVYRICYEGKPVTDFITCLQSHPEHM